MLDLYPPNYDSQIAEVLATSSKTQNLRSPTKKIVAIKPHSSDFLEDPEIHL